MASKKYLNLLLVLFFFIGSSISYANSPSPITKKIVLTGTLCLPGNFLSGQVQNWQIENLSCGLSHFNSQLTKLKSLIDDGGPQLVFFLQDFGSHTFYDRFNITQKDLFNNFKSNYFYEFWTSYWNLLIAPKNEQKKYFEIIESKISSIEKLCRPEQCRFILIFPEAPLVNHYFFSPLLEEKKWTAAIYTFLSPDISINLDNLSKNLSLSKNSKLIKIPVEEKGIDISFDLLSVQQDGGYFLRLINDEVNNFENEIKKQ